MILKLKIIVFINTCNYPNFRYLIFKIKTICHFSFYYVLLNLNRTSAIKNNTFYIIEESFSLFYKISFF
jgi:hypothetical protein